MYIKNNQFLNNMNIFSNFNKSNFPEILVNLNSNINSLEDYLDFENKWLDCYNQNKKFYFIFDITKVGMINPIYSYYLINFIKKLKTLNNNHLLNFSIIIVDNWYIKQLLFFVFNIQSPVSDVYIIEKNIDINSLINNINNNLIIKDDNIYIIYK